MILVVGATGLLGSEICHQLRERGHVVRALVRPGSSRENSLATRGVEIFHGDLKDAASIRRACKESTAVITTANAMLSRRAGDSLRSVDRDGHLNLLETARAAGVMRFVYTSASPNLSPRSQLIRYKREVELAVRKAGMTWTILQPSAFMEVYFGRIGGWDHERRTARICGSGTRPISYIAVSDVARSAVLAVERAELENVDLPLGGPAAVSPLTFVRTLEEISGRKYTVQRVPLTLVKLMGHILGPIHPITSSLLHLISEGAESGDVLDGSSAHRVPDLAPRVTVRVFAQRVLKPQARERGS